MVHIPTTQRKFYDNSVEADSLGMTASALAPAVREAQRVYAQQQDIKIDTNTTKARLELDNLNNEWRLANQGNPDNAEAKMQLQNDMQSILNSYGEGIDPMAKMKWNIAANKIMSAYELANNQWALGQRAENTKLDVAENINANLQIARNAGSAMDLESGLAEYQNSYNQLYKYAASNMGETEARKLLLDYEEDYMTSFVTGLSETDPKAALELLKKPEIAASFKKEGAQETMMKIVNKQIALQNFQRKVSYYNNEVKLSDKLDGMQTIDALKVLEESEGLVSSDWYKAKKKSLMSSAGITAETRAETATDILMDLAMLPTDDTAAAFFDASSKLITKIEVEYAKGNLSTTDKKNLLSQVGKREGKNIDELKKDTSDDSFWSLGDYTYKDAWNHIESNYVGSDKNQVLLEYFRTVNGQDYNKKQKLAELNAIIGRANLGDLQAPRFTDEQEAKEAYTRGKIKKGDTIYINGVRGKI